MTKDELQAKVDAIVEPKGLTATIWDTGSLVDIGDGYDALMPKIHILVKRAEETVYMDTEKVEDFNFELAYSRLYDRLLGAFTPPKKSLWYWMKEGCRRGRKFAEKMRDEGKL